MNVQERLQLKRIPLDKWSTREQLCLAMAVLCSGDQNWMSVSRALKMMCGTNRPTDWFSQKFCAAQYGKLLENVETPKRKKRTATERDNPTTPDTIVPGELIVRKLVQERNAELKKLVEEGQREYRQLSNDIRLLQSDALDDAQVLAMWEQIENENREKEKEQQKRAQWLKEREERKIEMERAWRPGAVSMYQNVNSMSPTSNSNSSGSPSRNSPSLSLKMNLPNSVKMEPADHQLGDIIMAGGADTPIKQGTSPLLTSLLKSPSSTPSTPVQGQQGTSRALAPTITTLLTSGQQAIKTNSPAITMNMPATGQFFNFHSPHPQHQQQQGGTVTTPSKAAPTLSKLLDASRKGEGGGGGSGAAMGSTEEDAINIDDDQQLMEVFKELMPDDLADILTADNNEMIVSPELLDQDLVESVPELIQHNQIAAQSEGAAGGGVEVKREAIHQATAQESKGEGVAGGGGVGSGSSTVADGKVNEDPKNDSAEGARFLGTMNNEEEHAAENQPTTSGIEEIPDDDEDEPVKGEKEESFVEAAIPEVEEEETLVVSQNVPAEEDAKEDDLDKQLEAITNGNEESVQEGNATDDVIDLDSEDANVSSGENAPEQHDGAGRTLEEEEEELLEALPEAEREDIEPEEKGEFGDCDKEAEVTTGDKGSVEDLTEEQNLLPPPATLVEESTDNQPKRSEERKVSTDNEDQFEDAKSTIGDSGNPPEDVEMNVSVTKATSESSSTTGGGEEKPKVESPAVDNMNSQPLMDTSFSDRSSRSRRDMPRRNRSQAMEERHATLPQSHTTMDRRHHLEDSGEETKSSSASNLSLRTRLKERDRSESPLVMDEDTSDVIPRTRRRYSSTPVIDSVPSSPASGDDREYKNWKKTVLIAFNQFSTLHYKYSAVLVQQVPEEFKNIILRPMDMQTIKKNIETGVIRTTTEFQRDVLLMVQNAIMMNTRRDRDWTNLINEMMVEVDYWKRETEKNMSSRENESAGGSRDGQSKVRNRKSQRITTAS